VVGHFTVNDIRALCFESSGSDDADIPKELDVAGSGVAADTVGVVAIVIQKRFD
jgi:hypothetical protein